MSAMTKTLARHLRNVKTWLGRIDVLKPWIAHKDLQ